MEQALLSFLSSGLFGLGWLGHLAVVLLLTHVTMAAVTIYLHRHQAHRALELHPIASHFFRFWLWLTTGMVTKQWMAVHRKHHARCETEEDPHSPWLFGIRKVLWQGAELYRVESVNLQTTEKFGLGAPDDWIERHLYTTHSALGIVLMLVINVVLFGVNGIWIWAVQMAWTPFFAAGVINGLGHFRGYRNFECQDKSTNLFPWGILIAGEELHNNHHSFASSAKLSYKWYEFDIGWFYIRLLSALRLANVRRTQPKIVEIAGKTEADQETLQAVVSSRYIIASAYAKSLCSACSAEIKRLKKQVLLPRECNRKALKVWLKQDARDTPIEQRQTLERLLQESGLIRTVYTMRQELSALWERSTMSSEQLLKRLEDWCSRAEASEIPSLQQFGQRLRRYRAG